MCKVLIVDDEEPVREAITLLGKWDELGIDKIIEATDGRNALKMVEEENPDIILVDMRMPEINGAEFLKIVADKYPNICSIVISGYDDFSFTKQAIKSKVIDYLLKPINREELNSALKTAVDIIKSRIKDKDAIIENNITLNVSAPVVKEKVFMSIIEGDYSEQDIQIYKNIIDASENKYYGITIVRIGNLEYIRKSQQFNNLELLYFAINNVLQEFYTGELKCFSFKNPKFEREVIIVTYCDCYSQYIDQLAFGCISKVTRKLKEILDISCIAAVGEMYENSYNLGQAYEATKSILNSYNILTTEAIIGKSSLEKLEHHKVTLMNMINIIKNAVENGSYSYIKNELGEFINKIKASGYFSISSSDKVLEELVLIMNNIAIELEVQESNDRNFGANLYQYDFHKLDYLNIREFEEVIYKASEYMYQKIRQNIRSKQNFNIEDIKEYIDNNYCQEIKVSMFTQKYYLSREYLMKLFKQQFGYGIYEYVQKIRMEKAKELLGDYDVKIQSISKIIGYSDNNYFSKAFRRYYGISPSGYRNMIMESSSKKIYKTM